MIQIRVIGLCMSSQSGKRCKCSVCVSPERLCARGSDRTLRTSRRNVVSVASLLAPHSGLTYGCNCRLPSCPLFTSSSPLYATSTTSSRFGRRACERAVRRSQAQIRAPSRIQSAPSMAARRMRLNRHNGPSNSFLHYHSRRVCRHL